jgi:predicted RNase H-related nuclease YkuK (DUF458 family)
MQDRGPGRGEVGPERPARGLFQSPSKGPLTFDRMFDDIIAFMAEAPEDRYTLIVGSDSQVREQETAFVTAVVIHRVGHGARYFYQRRSHRRLSSLRQKIFYEASLSLALAGRLAERLSENGHSQLNVEIHLDVGQGGETRSLIREIVGMVTGSGFDAKIKPYAYGASKVADRYTK